MYGPDYTNKHTHTKLADSVCMLTAQASLVQFNFAVVVSTETLTCGILFVLLAIVIAHGG